MEDGSIDTSKWTLVEDYNSEHGTSPSGFVEKDGSIGAHSSFSYSGDKARLRFNTFNKSTKMPAFDFKGATQIQIGSLLQFKYNDSCFGTGYGEYYFVDEHNAKAKFYEFKATSNGVNKEEATILLKNSSGAWTTHVNGSLHSSVSTSGLSTTDKWSIEFYSYLESGSQCSDSAYMDIWIREIKYLK